MVVLQRIEVTESLCQYLIHNRTLAAVYILFGCRVARTQIIVPVFVIQPQARSSIFIIYGCRVARTAKGQTKWLPNPKAKERLVRVQPEISLTCSVCTRLIVRLMLEFWNTRFVASICSPISSSILVKSQAVPLRPLARASDFVL